MCYTIYYVEYCILGALSANSSLPLLFHLLLRLGDRRVEREDHRGAQQAADDGLSARLARGHEDGHGRDQGQDAQQQQLLLRGRHLFQDLLARHRHSQSDT